MATQDKSKERLILEVQKKRAKRMRAKSRRKRLVAAVTAAVITAVTGIAVGASAKEITITEINEFDGTEKTTTVYTLKNNSVEEVLADKNVNVGEHDKINVSMDETATTDKNIVITRGKEITIVADGVEKNVVVTKADAHDALVEAGYVPGEVDEISVADGEDLKDGSKIELVSVGNDVDVVNEPIANSVEYVDDPEMTEGETKVLEEGYVGNKEVKSSVIYRSGEEFYRETISENVTLEPKNKVIAVGTKTPETPSPTASASSGGAKTAATVSEGSGTIDGKSYSKKIEMTATAYSTSPSENGGYTVSALGNPLGYGIVAVDPSVIPLGSTVYIAAADGSWVYGYASAEDTGGAIKGNKIDLCYDGANGGVSDFGRRSCVVYVLD